MADGENRGEPVRKTSADSVGDENSNTVNQILPNSTGISQENSSKAKEESEAKTAKVLAEIGDGPVKKIRLANPSNDVITAKYYVEAFQDVDRLPVVGQASATFNNTTFYGENIAEKLKNKGKWQAALAPTTVGRSEKNQRLANVDRLLNFGERLFKWLSMYLDPRNTVSPDSEEGQALSISQFDFVYAPATMVWFDLWRDMLDTAAQLRQFKLESLGKMTKLQPKHRLVAKKFSEGSIHCRGIKRRASQEAGTFSFLPEKERFGVSSTQRPIKIHRVERFSNANKLHLDIEASLAPFAKAVNNAVLSQLSAAEERLKTDILKCVDAKIQEHEESLLRQMIEAFNQP